MSPTESQFFFKALRELNGAEYSLGRGVEVIRRDEIAGVLELFDWDIRSEWFGCKRLTRAPLIEKKGDGGYRGHEEGPEEEWSSYDPVWPSVTTVTHEKSLPALSKRVNGTSVRKRK
ncbi:MAG: hypothetical protein C4293_10150 [Nitrospiraceae bacterium]